jgi:PAS domain S-box-containing protein
MRSARRWLRSLRREAGLREKLERVSESERRFRELADSAPVLIWTCNAEGLVDFVNYGWLEFTGRTAREELGDSWTVGVHPEDAGTVRATWWDAYERRLPWEQEYRLRTRDGSYRWIVDRGVPRHEDGTFAGFVGTAMDIHERKQAEERLTRDLERDHEVATTLQRTLLPERLPAVVGLALEARYLPAARGAAVGGDWYDVVELDGTRVAFVVGDVVGHGLRAAAVMGQLRNACRAYALLGSRPGETFEHLNRLLAVEGRNVMATAFYAVVDRESGEVSYSSAGHPPALVVGARGRRFLDAGRSVPLGTTDPIPYDETTDHLAEGETLLLYTDGLIERRGEPIDAGMHRLAEVAETVEGSLEELCDTLVRQVGAEGAPDDIALLAVRLEPADERLDLRLPADPAVLTDLRRRLGRLLRAAGASRQEQYEITLTVCEASANAIEHAYGPGDADFAVAVTIADGEVHVEVRDSGSWREQGGGREEEGTRGRGLGIIEGLMDDVQVSRSESGTTVTMRRKLESATAA